jgi:hypothetical protein
MSAVDGVLCPPYTRVELVILAAIVLFCAILEASTMCNGQVCMDYQSALDLYRRRLQTNLAGTYVFVTALLPPPLLHFFTGAFAEHCTLLHMFCSSNV